MVDIAGLVQGAHEGKVCMLMHPDLDLSSAPGIARTSSGGWGGGGGGGGRELGWAGERAGLVRWGEGWGGGGGGGGRGKNWAGLVRRGEGGGGW